MEAEILQPKNFEKTFESINKAKQILESSFVYSQRKINGLKKALYKERKINAEIHSKLEVLVGIEKKAEESQKEIEKKNEKIRDLEEKVKDLQEKIQDFDQVIKEIKEKNEDSDAGT